MLTLIFATVQKRGHSPFVRSTLRAVPANGACPLFCAAAMGALWAAALGPAQDVAFTARWDGTEQRYVLMLPEGFAAGQTHDLLVALHGHGSDRWQFVRSPRDECRAARDVAAEHAMIYVSPDYRAKTSWMGPGAEADLVQIITELKHQGKRRTQHHLRRQSAGSRIRHRTAAYELARALSISSGSCGSLVLSPRRFSFLSRFDCC